MELANFTEYIKPELLVLIPVLYIVGEFIKKAEGIDNKHIPVLLMAIGMVLSALWVYGTTEFAGSHEVALAIFTAAVQGILVAGAAVLTNNVVKQYSVQG